MTPGLEIESRAIGQCKSLFAKLGRAIAFAGLLVLAACQSTNTGIGIKPPPEGTTPTSTASGEVLGSGSVRIAMLLPKSAPGNAAEVANQVRNGAALAMQDFGQGTIELVIKDTGGQAAGAQSAATEAVREGAAAILGPVFAANVSAASAITLPSGKTMIAFSTDSSVAKRNVYLLSYTPQDDTRRIVRYVLSKGRRSILAFLPSNAEGTLREAVLRQEAGAAGANLRVFKYERSTESIQQAVASTKEIIDGFDAIYIPEGNEIPNVILQSMHRLGINTVGKQIMGSGAWESVQISEAQLENALYPGRDLTRFEDFATRYETINGARPDVWAALGYDAVTLVTDLVSRLGPQAFTQAGLENPRGYTGVNGIFRLRSNGTSERGLAIYAVVGGQREQIEPAPQSFAQLGN